MSDPNPNYKTSALIVGCNLVVLAAYQICYATSSYANIASAFAILLHIMLCIVISAIFYRLEKPNAGHGFIASSLFVLLVGMGTCSFI